MEPAHQNNTSESSWRDTYSLYGREACWPIQQHKYNKCIVLQHGDASSWDFPPLAPIIASSIQDVSRSDRRCLITTSSLLHGRQIGSTCWICVVSSFCRSGGILSFDIAQRIPPLSLTLALFVFSHSYSFFFLFFSSAGGTCELLRWICQILSNSQPGLTGTASALAACFVTPLTLCFQISSLPTVRIIMAPLWETVCSCISRGIITGWCLSVGKKKKRKPSYR